MRIHVCRGAWRGAQGPNARARLFPIPDGTNPLSAPVYFAPRQVRRVCARPDVGVLLPECEVRRMAGMRQLSDVAGEVLPQMPFQNLTCRSPESALMAQARI